MFPVDGALLAEVRARLRRQPGLRFVVGPAGSGKSTVCASLARREGLAVLDMDERMYGSWHGRFDPRRHPASRAWSEAPDPLGWQLRLDPEAFLQWHAASTVEGLDLLATELDAGPPRRAELTTVVDGGFGSVASLARAVPVAHIVCLVLPEAEQDRVWHDDGERRAFLAEIAAGSAVDDPVARFLALDRALGRRMREEAVAAGVTCLDRTRTADVAALAASVATHLAIG